jgi:hypothetical protein
MKKALSITLCILLAASLASAKQSAERFLSVQGANAILFTSLDSTFAPLIDVTGSPTILWTFADGTTSGSATPSKNYGSQAARINSLVVTPWSALRGINLGYQAGIDSAPASLTSNHDTTIVSKVENLYLVAPYLTHFTALNNYLTSVSFDNFTALTNVEMYGNPYLASISVRNTPSLKRVVTEGGALTTLDLSDCSSLEEIRSAYNDLTSITYPAVNDHLWHICTHHNPFTNTSLYADTTNFPQLVQLWVQSANQTGTFKAPATGPTTWVTDETTPSFQLEGNSYTSADFTGAMTNASESWLVRFTNGTDYDTALTSLTLTGCAGLTSLDISHTSLAQAQLDSVLATIDGLGRTGGTIIANNLTSSVTPGSAGWQARAHLVTKGWTVTTDGTQPLAIGTGPSLDSMQVDEPFSQTLAAVAGSSPYSWDVTSGSIAGLSLSSAGVLSGTPTTSGPYSITVRVTDGDSNTAPETYTGTVSAGTNNIAYVNSATGVDNSGTAGTTISTSSFAATAGNLIFVIVKHGSDFTSTATVTDTAGNTYTAIGSLQANSPNLGASQVFYAHNITGNAGNVVTATLQNACAYREIAVVQYSGIATSNPLGSSPTPVVQTASVSSGTSNTFSTTQANELVIAAVNTYGGETYTAGSAGTHAMTIRANTGGTCIEDYMATAQQANITSSLSWSSASPYTMFTVTFKAGE